MTIKESIKKIQGKRPGVFIQPSIKYAEQLLLPDEKVVAAVAANIFVSRENFPGVVVLTDQRIIAVCGLPGVKRSAIFPLTDMERCEETRTIVQYKVTFITVKSRFSFTVNPDDGVKLSPYIAAINGEEFDSIKLDTKHGIFNEHLIENSLRKKKAKERKTQQTLQRQNAAAAYFDSLTENQQISNQ